MNGLSAGSKLAGTIEQLAASGWPPRELEALAPRAFATIYEAGEPMGVATATIEAGWAGISNVVVDPRHRRKGVAGRLLHALASWAVENGAEGMYLQVLAGNAPALELYGKLGFRAVSAYHYRVRK